MLGVKGLKKWTSRYCVFNDEECKLYLYNSKNDSTCCGLVCLSVYLCVVCCVMLSSTCVVCVCPSVCSVFMCIYKRLYIAHSRCIDISVASFIYHVACPNQFSIVTGRQDHVMQAHNEEAMMYWLTQLQVISITALYILVTMVT